MGEEEEKEKSNNGEHMKDIGTPGSRILNDSTELIKYFP